MNFLRHFNHQSIPTIIFITFLDKKENKYIWTALSFQRKEEHLTQEAIEILGKITKSKQFYRFLRIEELISPWKNNHVRDVHCFMKAILRLPMEVSIIIVHCHVILHAE